MTDPVNPAADEMPSSGGSLPLTGSPPFGPLLSWLVAVVLVLSAIGIVAAHVPTRVKLLGLFSVAVGWVMGAASSAFAKAMRLSVTPQIVLAVGVLTLVALAASAQQAFLLDAASRAVSPREQQMALNLMRQMEQDSGGEITAAPVGSATDQFRQYLARRVRQLGAWPSPWPELFWVIELLAGGVAAMWGLRSGVRPGKGQPAVTGVAP